MKVGMVVGKLEERLNEILDPSRIQQRAGYRAFKDGKPRFRFSSLPTHICRLIATAVLEQKLARICSIRSEKSPDRESYDQGPAAPNGVAPGNGVELPTPPPQALAPPP